MSDNLNIQRWIKFAQRDYDAAYNMSILHNPIPLEIVCYLCQQCAEKILKAYALANSEPLVKTHDLKSVLKQCMSYNDDFAAFADSCAVLTEYATASRYPLDEDWIEQQDMEIALEY
jgi:HEPN domain-containing protein